LQVSQNAALRAPWTRKSFPTFAVHRILWRCCAKNIGIYCLPRVLFFITQRKRNIEN